MVTVNHSEPAPLLEARKVFRYFLHEQFRDMSMHNKAVRDEMVSISARSVLALVCGEVAKALEAVSLHKEIRERLVHTEKHESLLSSPKTMGLLFRTITKGVNRAGEDDACILLEELFKIEVSEKEEVECIRLAVRESLSTYDDDQKLVRLLRKHPQYVNSVAFICFVQYVLSLKREHLTRTLLGFPKVIR